MPHRPRADSWFVDGFPVRPDRLFIILLHLGFRDTVCAAVNGLIAKPPRVHDIHRDPHPHPHQLRLQVIIHDDDRLDPNSPIRLDPLQPTIYANFTYLLSSISLY